MFTPKGRIRKLDSSILNPEGIGIRYVLVPVETDGSTINDVFSKWKAAHRDYRSWWAESYGNMVRWLGQSRQTLIQSDLLVVAVLCVNKGEIDGKAVAKAMKEFLEDIRLHDGSIHVLDGNFAELVTAPASEKGINVNVYSK